MLRFSVPLFLVLGVSTMPVASLRTSRQLSYAKIAGYEPETVVTDHNALDLDQQEIETHLGLETPDFTAAYSVYSEGFASKSTATITVTALESVIPAGTRVTGKANDGSNTSGVTTTAARAGATSIEVEYEVSEDQDNHVRCMVGGSSQPMTEGCFSDAGGDLTANGKTVPYTSVVNTNARTIRGFSINANERYRPAEDTSNPFFPDFQKFVDYYGTYDYADKWISGALLGEDAGLKNGNVDFASIDPAARVEAAKKGTSYMNVAMYAIREMEDAIDDCERGCDTTECNLDAVHAWDEAVAFYTGSLEETDGSGDGLFFYSLAEKRCANFKTCGSNGNELTGTSKINIEVFKLFDEGKRVLAQKDCAAGRTIKEKIVKKMWVPYIQGSLRYAWKLENEPFDVEAEAEGAVFLAGVLPMINACNAEDAATLKDQMWLGKGGTTDYGVYKGAMERNYGCLGVTCADVGGLYNEATGEYEAGAGPCGSGRKGSSSNSDVNMGLAVGLPIGLLALFALIYFFMCRKRKGNVEFKSNDTGSGV
ncbi:hypothetical protein MPSEU_000221500 [Mayamaea pseudoterrestris]|nr:hypothetical protein MPSEU_000221500 [Mayamaea pseudoterrestris]